MNKLLRGISIFVLFCGMVLVFKPVNIQAAAPEVTWEDQTWSAGTATTIDLVKNPSPEWLQLLSGGVKVNANTLICHPFRKGSYHWVAEIRQLVNGKWIKQNTTTGWNDTEESTYQACTTTTSDGVYALFGYYNGPAENFSAVVAACSYDTSNWDIETDGDYIVFTADNLEGVETVSFTVLSTTGEVLIDPLSASGITLEHKKTYYSLLTTFEASEAWTARIQVSVPGCTWTKDFISPVG